MLDERFLANPETSVEMIASTIVHEATHAKLERLGVSYAEDRRARIEAFFPSLRGEPLLRRFPDVC